MSDYYDMNGKPITMQEWARVYESDDRVIARTDLEDGIWVSTVHLGIDHQFGDGPPLIFETMVFGPENMIEKDMMRYSTKEEAAVGHEEMVTKWNGWVTDG